MARLMRSQAQKVGESGSGARCAFDEIERQSGVQTANEISNYKHSS